MSPHVKMTLDALHFSDYKDSSLAVEMHLRFLPQIPVARIDFSCQGQMEKPVLLAAGTTAGACPRSRCTARSYSSVSDEATVATCLVSRGVSYTGGLLDPCQEDAMELVQGRVLLCETQYAGSCSGTIQG